MSDWKKENIGRKVIVISGRYGDDSESNAGKIAKFMGIPHINISTDLGTLAKAIYENSLAPKQLCIIVNARTLGDIFKEPQKRKILKDIISDGKQVLFIYGVNDSEAEIDLIRQLTDNSILAVRKRIAARLKCQVSSKARKYCKQLSSLGFEVDIDQNTSTFMVGKNIGEDEILATIDGEAFFLHIAIGQGEVFLSGCSQIADLEEKVKQENLLLSKFTSLIPLMMVLRYVFKERSWHNSMMRACFIIDDPLLKKSYGYLDYRKILKMMREKGFCTSIAFIPWNYRRTNRETAFLFQKNEDKLSLSIHGCDHTKGEFGGSNGTFLRYKAGKALERMRIHQQRSGISFDKIMVFPQGIFSTYAMKELKSSGYLAAVNSTPYPVNMENESHTLEDLLELAITRYSDFPLLIRRYPKDLAGLALDLFLGKPALIVEHHTFFRYGYEVLSNFIDNVKSLEEGLEWSGLGKICSQACLKKVDENGGVHVKFYADQFQLKNTTDRPQYYLLHRRMVSDERSPEVRINGMITEFEQKNGALKIPVSLNAGEKAEIEVEQRKCDEKLKTYRQTRAYNAKVLARRLLSEFRDNFVEKSPILSEMITNTRQMLAMRKTDESPSLIEKEMK